MAAIVERNIAALREETERRQAAKGLSERIADAITGFTGSMTFVFLHVTVFGVWIVANLDLLPVPPWDPSFVVLAMVASVEAIFLSTFILISQNAMSAAADRRADLDLQINLLAEHEITRLIELVTAIARRLDALGEPPPDLAEASRDVRPEQVMRRIDEAGG
ncbi:putative membrane protein [Bosea sp. OAE506]|uniref:DUF1003 domain-containing protein n=1 Tax=Bosea sp. OAE506 TaxID=2663870 RepID=UPI0019EC765F